MKNKILILSFIIILSSCAYETAQQTGSQVSGRVHRIEITQSSDEFVRLKYSNCVFCKDLPQTALNVANEHCGKYNSKAVLIGKRVAQYYDYDTYRCRGTKKKLTFEEKKEIARKKCLSIGFKDSTKDMSNCILKFVSEN